MKKKFSKKLKILFYGDCHLACPRPAGIFAVNHFKREAGNLRRPKKTNPNESLTNSDLRRQTFSNYNVDDN